MGSLPALRPRGSSVFLAEERNRALNDTILRTKDSHREWDVDIILTHVSMVMNSMVVQSGFTANQTVFGAKGGDTDLHAFSESFGPPVDAERKERDLLQDLSPASPFLASLKMREVAQTTLTSVITRKCVARLSTECAGWGLRLLS